ncbi:hypothetical protein HN031_15425 [Nocardioides sp. zg-1308]|jgi:hypothetical protein|uniref:hypothetical protein n=1 Tax=Nocardioides sp. zg-1308 TaxID=2736253 RepID=UPI001552BB65|nr:hypothetical protein [Nocardioides sp. zg-1308]NPD06070.1 hypothetical protein [Nocardioides sp. zg-1308]
MPTIHRSIQDSTAAIPVPGTGDRDVEFVFDAPRLSASTSRDDRPFLSYTVNPLSNAEANLVVSINGTEIVNETFTSSPKRTLVEIFDRSVLDGTDNDLRVLVPSPGSLSVSDLIVGYTSA